MIRELAPLTMSKYVRLPPADRCRELGLDVRPHSDGFVTFRDDKHECKDRWWLARRAAGPAYIVAWRPGPDSGMYTFYEVDTWDEVKLMYVSTVMSGSPL